MTKTGRYTKRVWLQVTPEMYQFVELMAERQRSSVNDVIRQAIREYLVSCSVRDPTIPKSAGSAGFLSA